VYDGWFTGNLLGRQQLPRDRFFSLVMRVSDFLLEVLARTGDYGHV
jgi:hypothetical protein